jgi:hypothetical protein
MSRPTLGITRPPKRLSLRATLLRVGCMPLLCCALQVNTPLSSYRIVTYYFRQPLSVLFHPDVFAI